MRLEQLRDAAKEKQWLMRITVNVCRDMTRTAWFRYVDRRVALDNLPGSAGPFSPQDDTLVIAVMELPQKYREAVLLHYYQDMPANDCARALGLSLSGFYRRLNKAHALLKNKLKGWEDDA